jgi:hypothetical protein
MEARTHGVVLYGCQISQRSMIDELILRLNYKNIDLNQRARSFGCSRILMDMYFGFKRLEPNLFEGINTFGCTSL